MFKPFFVHFNRPVRAADSKTQHHKPRGYTLYVTPGDKPREVGVQATFCSTQDEFVKKHGRSFAMQAERVTFNPRDLPNLAASMANACRPDWKRSEQDFLYLLKYVV